MKISRIFSGRATVIIRISRNTGCVITGAADALQAGKRRPVSLPELLQEYLNDPFNEQRGRRLSMQGAVVGRFLVHALLHSDKTDDRLSIFNLLTSTGKILLPILRELLPEPMPWHGKRNLIRLLAATGEEQDIDLVTPYLFHDDLRVQRESFDCLYRISGDRKKEVLLRVASEAGELLRLDAVKALVFFCDEETAAVLGELLGEHEHFSANIRDALLTNVCKVLGHCPCPPAVTALQEFLQLKGKRGCLGGRSPPKHYHLT